MSSWRELAERGRLFPHVLLGQLTTYKLGGPARLMARLEESDDLDLLFAGLQETPMPVLILGRGSNVLISDRGFDGVVAHLGAGFSWVNVERGQVAAGGATFLPLLARAATRAGEGNLEFFIGIPGSVGGAVRMNAGCHGTETADVLVEAEVFDLRDGSRNRRSPFELGMSYRHSSLSDLEVVTAVEFRTDEVEVETGEQTLREVSRWRKENQPGGTLNAGSVFKNPPGDAAGRLVDAAGLKGHSMGSVSVSTRHANFIVAERDATAQDVFDLIEEVARLVHQRTGVQLVPEIRFAGDFGDGTTEESPG